MSYWKQYWADKTNPQHRFQTEDFFQKYAKEKLYHLDGGRTLLDFGCGSGEVLIYYSEHYRKIVGVDISQSMLDIATQRLKEQGKPNVALIRADDESMWEKIDNRFDRISSSGVVQYLTGEQLDKFISNAAQYLTEDGKILLFDVIDPRIFWLFRAGLFRSDQNVSLIRMATGLLLSQIRGLLRKLKGLPSWDIGYSYHPLIVEDISKRHGLEMEYVCSMYYEYRYHAILTPNV